MRIWLVEAVLSDAAVVSEMIDWLLDETIVDDVLTRIVLEGSTSKLLLDEGSALLDGTTIDDGTALALAAAVLVGCSSI